MPSCNPATIPAVIDVVRRSKPQSILDVGIGFGKWGYLFREYTDILGSEKDPQRYTRDGWKTKIDGIEIFKEYLHPGHDYIYNNIFIGDVNQLINEVGEYDIIFWGGVIEHFKLDVGIELVKKSLQKANKYVILTTPRFNTHQEDLCDNEHEIHHCVWSKAIFREIAPCDVIAVDARSLVAIFPVGSECSSLSKPSFLKRLLNFHAKG